MREEPSSRNCFPPGIHEVLLARHKIIKRIRDFFDQRGYIEVETPIRVKCPGIDPYIEPLSSGAGYYLATSPELHMKRLLASGMDRIYQITRAFRSEECGYLHNSEFSMLEWYRTEADCSDMMLETEQLLRFVCDLDDLCEKKFIFPFSRLTVDELFTKTAGWAPSTRWDEDRYFKDWVEKAEPYLKTVDAVLVSDFPAPLSALSKAKDNNPLVCQRIELYLKGIEIANAYSELTGIREHEFYFKQALEKIKASGKTGCGIDKGFMDSVRTGIPESGGIALGIDRLVMGLLEKDKIQDVIAFPEKRL